VLIFCTYTLFHLKTFRSILNGISSPVFLLVLLLLLYTHICLSNLEGDVLRIMPKCFNSFFITYNRAGTDQSVQLLGYVMDVRGIIFRFPTRSRTLSLLQSVQNGFEFHQLSTEETSGALLIRENRRQGAKQTIHLHLYRGADKSLARPGRKQATATEDFDIP